MTCITGYYDLHSESQGAKGLKNIGDNSKIECDEITNVRDSVSTNFHSKKVRCKIDFCNLPTILLVIILLFLIVIAKHRSKLKKNPKKHCLTKNIKT